MDLLAWLCYVGVVLPLLPQSSRVCNSNGSLAMRMRSLLYPNKHGPPQSGSSKGYEPAGQGMSWTTS
jgi:hypothetical protein